MTIFRLLMLAAIGWFVFRIVRSWSAQPAGTRRPGPEQYELMARCGRCGVHVPRDAVSERGRCTACEKVA
jgi:hypothetical protein